jgi:hypothetical protein
MGNATLQQALSSFRQVQWSTFPSLWNNDEIIERD